MASGQAWWAWRIAETAWRQDSKIQGRKNVHTQADAASAHPIPGSHDGYIYIYSLLNSGVDIYTHMVRMYICICVCINMCESQNMSGYYKYDVDLFDFHAFEVEGT